MSPGGRVASMSNLSKKCRFLSRITHTAPWPVAAFHRKGRGPDGLWGPLGRLLSRRRLRGDRGRRVGEQGGEFMPRLTEPGS